MANEQKIKLSKWLEFGITCLTILAKFVKEIIEIIPTKGE
jgi:hypothetical protein